MRRDRKVCSRNKSQISALKTAIKKAKSNTLESSTLQKAQSLTDRAARKGLIPRNRAARWVSSLMQQK